MQQLYVGKTNLWNKCGPRIISKAVLEGKLVLPRTPWAPPDLQNDNPRNSSCTN